MNSQTATRHPDNTHRPSRSELRPIGRRVEELDALRGIAALTVVFHHCLVALPAFWAFYEIRDIPVNPILAVLAFSPLHLAWGGVEAVNLFFVLSGLVLAFPFLGSEPPQYAAFVLKRIIRIYIPYIFVMTAAILLMEALLPLRHPNGSSWLQHYWGHHADGRTVRDYVLMLGMPTEAFVNPVTWSLVHELRICLVYPILIALVKTRKPWQLLLTALLFSLGAKLTLHIMTEFRWWSTIIDTCQYVFFFVAGAELAKHRAWLSSFYISMPKPAQAGTLAFSLLLLNARWEIPSAMRGVSALCIWAGAILIVALSLASSGEGTILRRKPLAWLGRVSYSLYLTHCIILFSGLFLFHSKVPLPLIVACVPIVSLCVAAVVYRAVELPVLSLARKRFPINSRGCGVSMWILKQLAL